MHRTNSAVHCWALVFFLFIKFFNFWGCIILKKRLLTAILSINLMFLLTVDAKCFAKGNETVCMSYQEDYASWKSHFEQDLGYCTIYDKKIVEDLEMRIMVLEKNFSEIQKYNNELETKLLLLTGVAGFVLGGVLFSNAWKVLKVTARTINMWSNGIFEVGELSKRLKIDEDRIKFLEQRLNALSVKIVEKGVLK